MCDGLYDLALLTSSGHNLNDHDVTKLTKARCGDTTNLSLEVYLTEVTAFPSLAIYLAVLERWISTDT